MTGASTDTVARRFAGFKNVHPACEAGARAARAKKCPMPGRHNKRYRTCKLKRPGFAPAVFLLRDQETL